MLAANKVSISIRLYTPHDVDLICLYRNPDFDFCKAVKASCRAFIRQSNERISQPLLNRPRKYFGDLPRITALHLILDKEKDADLIELLVDTVYAGVRNSFIKNLLRAYMSGFDGSLYFASNYIKHADEANASLMVDGTVITKISHSKKKSAKKRDNVKKQKISARRASSKSEKTGKVSDKKEPDEKSSERQSIKPIIRQSESFIKEPRPEKPTEVVSKRHPVDNDAVDIDASDAQVGETIDDGGAVGNLFAKMMNNYQ